MGNWQQSVRKSLNAFDEWLKFACGMAVQMQAKSRIPLWYFRGFRYSSECPVSVVVGVHDRFGPLKGLPQKGAAVADNIHMADTDRDLPKHVRNGFMRYRDFQPLTQGGEAVLRTCLDENLGRTVVMKTLLPQYQNLETYQKRFLREARVTAQIPHPCTIPVYELSRDAEGNAYFTMKRLRGRDLSEILDRIAEGDPEFISRYPLQAIINALLHCAQCLAFAHNQGVVHRDMKPANIMIGDYGEIMVMDWGLAKVSSMKDNEEFSQLLRSGQQNIPGRLTGRGDVQGTPFYMSPEQAVETGDVDERSDIFNMGIILFEVLTSESYVSGRNFREIRRRLQEDPVRSPRSVAPGKNIPPELNAICVKALQKNPADRYQKMSDFENDLRAWLCGTPVSVYQQPLLRRLLKWRDHKLLCSASLLWMLIGAGICIALQLLVSLLR
ncbi:MAG: Serine/threonine-protein kinase PknD [Planctomycetota bacterium]|jgi:serine/threonine-protein kinase